MRDRVEDCSPCFQGVHSSVTYEYLSIWPSGSAICQANVTSLEQATLYNVAGVASILILSFLAGRTYPSAFFNNWTRAYLGGLILLLLEFSATRVGRPPWLVLSEIALVAAICWFFVQTGRILQGHETLPKRWGAMGVLASVALGGLLTIGQVSFTWTFGPFVMVYSALHVWLGYQLIRASRQAGSSGASYLGLPLIGSGVWFFSYPLVEPSSFAWLGYLVSAILNVLVGSGMLVFLVEDAARKLRLKNEELTQLDRLKTSFLDAMSHEFKTPLTSINTAAWLLRHKSPVPPTPFQTELIDTLQEQIQVLNRLLNDVLTYSAVANGSFSYEFTPRSMHELVEQVARAMRPSLERAHLEFVCVLPEGDVMAEVDGDRIKQVLMNLLSNALKFVPAGGEVRLVLSETPDTVVISVSDTGPGIAPEHQAQIFERFFQVRSGASKAAGLGLGLSLSRAIVEEGHGGKLWLDKDVTVGSRFVLEFPQRRVNRGAALQPVLHSNG